MQTARRPVIRAATHPDTCTPTCLHIHTPRHMDKAVRTELHGSQSTHVHHNSDSTDASAPLYHHSLHQYCMLVLCLLSS
ncbi:hypothetical protein B484DRAFT_65466 [Ochromonadaceae sp. CCMP2298]|nr:hypothetical protein B484DRAFT_65466 [Ochromonadaceae sp. CCMP2298]